MKRETMIQRLNRKAYENARDSREAEKRRAEAAEKATAAKNPEKAVK